MSIPEKKIKIRTREDFFGPKSGEGKATSATATNFNSTREEIGVGATNLQTNQQQKIQELNQKNEKYQQMKNKYVTDDDNFEEIFLEEQNLKKSLLIPNSRLKMTSPVFDPEFIRDPTPYLPQQPAGQSWSLYGKSYTG